MENIEKAHKCITKMTPELSQIKYEERLNKISILYLEMCRLREDLIEVSKIVKGIDNVDKCSFFQPSCETRIRGNMFTFLTQL